MLQLIQFSNKGIFFILLLTIISCKKEERNIKQNKKTTKEFYNDGVLKKMTYFLNNDTIFERNFSASSKLVSEGNIFKNRLIGKWTFYDNNGKIEKQIEYINLCGRQYVNQGWYLNEKGDTIKNKSNYFNFKLKTNKLKKNDQVELKFYYNRILFNNSNLMLCISPDIDENYCNALSSKTVCSLSTTDTLYAKIGFSTTGKKNIRGYIKEFYKKKSDIIDTTTSGERIVYFKIAFEVN